MGIRPPVRNHDQGLGCPWDCGPALFYLSDPRVYPGNKDEDQEQRATRTLAKGITLLQTDT